MRLYLIVYDRQAGKLLRIQEYPPDQRGQALADRFRIELAERARPEIEVVVLAADSMESLRRTHGRYFFREASFPMAEAL